MTAELAQTVCVPLLQQYLNFTAELCSSCWLACFHWKTCSQLWAKCSLYVDFGLEGPMGKWEPSTVSSISNLFCWLGRWPTWASLTRLLTQISAAARHTGQAHWVGLGICLLLIGAQLTWAQPARFLTSWRAGPPESLALQPRRLEDGSEAHPQARPASAAAADWVHKANKCCPSCPTNITNRGCLNS